MFLGLFFEIKKPWAEGFTNGLRTDKDLIEGEESARSCDIPTPALAR